MGAPSNGYSGLREDVPALSTVEHIVQPPTDSNDEVDARSTPELPIRSVHVQHIPVDVPSPGSQRPLSEWDILLGSLRATPDNSAGWVRLVRLAEESSDAVRIKDAYEALLSVYPDAVSDTVTSCECG